MKPARPARTLQNAVTGHCGSYKTHPYALTRQWRFHRHSVLKSLIAGAFSPSTCWQADNAPKRPSLTSFVRCGSRSQTRPARVDGEHRLDLFSPATCWPADEGVTTLRMRCSLTSVV